MKNSYNAKCWQQQEIGSFVSNETKHTFPIMIQQLHSWAFIPEKWKLLVTQKPNCWAFIPEKWKLNRHTKTSAWQFHFSLIHNTLKLETIQMSFKTGILSSHDLVPEDLSWNWCNNKEMKCTINGMHLNHPEIIPIPSHLLSMEKLSYTKPVQSLYQKSWALLL